MNKERLVFEVTDGVKTLEEVTPWEGGAHVSGDEIFFLQHSNYYISESYSGGSIMAFIGCKTGDRLEYSSSANTSGELSQSSGEPILAFIGCKTGGKPNR